MLFFFICGPTLGIFHRQGSGPSRTPVLPSFSKWIEARLLFFPFALGPTVRAKLSGPTVCVCYSQLASSSSKQNQKSKPALNAEIRCEHA